MRYIPRASLASATEVRSKRTKPPLSVIVRRPIALLSFVPTPIVLFAAGALAGAVGKTVVAPLDRVKILLQVRGGLQRGAVREAAASGDVLRSLWAILKSEGILGFWKGNLPQLMRVIPYSAVQLASYELLKNVMKNENGDLSVIQRLVAGALAGMCSTIVTYPLDSLRFRLAVDPEVKSVRIAFQALANEAGISAFYRGLKPAVLGIAPYMALELTSYDLLPHSIPSFARGFLAAFLASSFCYPLDTIRRMKQLSTAERMTSRQVARQIWKQEGISGLYRGFVPNAMKNLPNKGIRLSTFDAVKTLLIASHKAYDEELSSYYTAASQNKQ